MWAEAHEKAKELASAPNSELIHPFDHEEIWEV
jgi:threonine dehydratase